MVKEDLEPIREFVDVSSMTAFPSSRPTVQNQIDALHAIHSYNKALPKRRKARDSLGEFETSNLAATFTVHRDPKKKTLTVNSKYNQVGIVDGCVPS